jgi:hypothetical protein
MTEGEVRGMLGIVQWERNKGKKAPERAVFGPLEGMVVTLSAPPGLPDWRLRRRVRRLGGTLRRLDVHRLIVPGDLPHPDLLSHFHRVDPVPFYRGMADVLALGYIACKGKEPVRETVALTGPRLCPELMAAAERLCPQVRGVSIQVPGEGEGYAGWLHRRYGLPVTPPEGAAVTVAFGPGGERWGQELPLYEGGGLPEGLELRLEGLELPQWCAPELLTVLWERGTLPRERLQVRQWGAKGRDR